MAHIYSCEPRFMAINRDHEQKIKQQYYNKNDGNKLPDFLTPGSYQIRIIFVNQKGEQNSITLDEFELFQPQSGKAMVEYACTHIQSMNIKNIGIKFSGDSLFAAVKFQIVKKPSSDPVISATCRVNAEGKIVKS